MEPRAKSTKLEFSYAEYAPLKQPGAAVATVVLAEKVQVEASDHQDLRASSSWSCHHEVEVVAQEVHTVAAQTEPVQQAKTEVLAEQVEAQDQADLVDLAELAEQQQVQQQECLAKADLAEESAPARWSSSQTTSRR